VKRLLAAVITQAVATAEAKEEALVLVVMVTKEELLTAVNLVNLQKIVVVQTCFAVLVITFVWIKRHTVLQEITVDSVLRTQVPHLQVVGGMTKKRMWIAAVNVLQMESAAVKIYFAVLL